MKPTNATMYQKNTSASAVAVKMHTSIRPMKGIRVSTKPAAIARSTRILCVVVPSRELVTPNRRPGHHLTVRRPAPQSFEHDRVGQARALHSRGNGDDDAVTVLLDIDLTLQREPEDGGRHRLGCGRALPDDSAHHGRVEVARRIREFVGHALRGGPPHTRLAKQ